MDRFTIRPAEAGARITDPETGDVIPAEGRELPRNAYWIALVMRGDMIEIAPPKRGRQTTGAADAVANATEPATQE